MRSKRLELQETLKNQRPSPTKRQEALQKLKSSTKQPLVAFVDDPRANEIGTEAVDEGLNVVSLKNQRLSATKPCSAFVNGNSADKIVTDEVGERLNVVAREKQGLSATKPCTATIVSGKKANEIVTDVALGERLNAVALEKKRPLTIKPCSAIVDGPKANKCVTDAVDERCNTVALKKQKSSATKPCSASVNGRRAKEMVTDAVVGERLNAAALEKQKSLTIKPRTAFVNGRRAKEIVTVAMDERDNASLFLLRSRGHQQQNHVPAIVNGQGPKEIATDAVGERLNVVALEKQRSSTTKPCSAIVNGSWSKKIMNIAVDARPNAVALKNQRSSVTKPCNAFIDGSRANEIVTDPVDERLNVVDDMLDSWSDIRDEGADKLDTWSSIRDEYADILDSDGNGDVQIVEDQLLLTNSDENADILDSDGNGDMQIVEDQSLPTNSDEDAGILDADGDSDMQIAENQSLSTDSDEYADILDADGNNHMQILEDQLLPTNSEKVVGLSRKRKRDNVRRQVTGLHIESNANCTGNGQGSTSRPSGTRTLIIFDKYGRPCDVGSEQFSTAVGKIVRARCPPAVHDWRIVAESVKEDIWKNIVAKYVVPEVHKPNILSRARHSWKNWKSLLRVEMDRHETIAEKKINMPVRLIPKREDWESFVDFCNTDEDRKRRATGKKSRESLEFKQSWGRRGIYRKIYDLEKESPAGEVNRSAIILGTHVSKTINDPESFSISDIKMRSMTEPVEAYPDSQNDIVALVCGRDSGGVVKGIGGCVSRTKVRDSAGSIETLREVQKENKSLQSDIQLLLAQSGKCTQNSTSTPSNQSVSNLHNRTSTPSYQSASQAPDASSLPAPSRLPPDLSNLSVRSRLAPLTSNLLASSCFIKNFKGRTIALGSFNTADPPMEHVYSLIIEDIFDRDAELFDKDGKLGDIIIGGVINWPKACVESNLPASSCFIRNFKRRTIGFGSFSTADPQMEHVYSVIVKEIFDRDAELFDTDGKLGDIMIGGVINWPKACIKPCQQ